MMVSDMTRKETLLSIRSYWLPEVKNLVGTVPFVILINKCDLTPQAEIKEEGVRKFASRYMAPYFFTSAKNGENVKNAFFALGNKMLEMKRTEAPRPARPEVIEDGKSEMSMVIDKIIDDFCKVYGNVEDAMPILRRQFKIAELDLNNPKKKSVRIAIERLAQIEKDFKEWEIAEANRLKRLKWLKEVKYW